MISLPRFRPTWNSLLFISITCLGISHVITQLTLLRELLAVFYGNELTIGIILANWMLLTGIGAYVGRFFRSHRSGLYLLLISQVLVAVLPIALIFVIRVVRDMVFIRGELLGLTRIFLSTFVLLLPYCLLTGMLLTLACSLFSLRDSKARIGTVYFLDNIGDILGGSLFTFVLVYFLNSFQIVYVPAALNLVSVIMLAAHSRKRVFSATAAVFAVALIVFLSVGRLDRFTIEKQYEGQTVVLHKDSLYGKLVVIRQDEQYSFFNNGSLLFSTGDLLRAERTVHYAMAQTEAPERVLLISGGVTGTARQILKHGVKRVDYVELDPALVAIGTKYTDNLDDDRIHTVTMDGRLFVERTKAKYDAVILDLPEPATIQINRMYTIEFFEAAKRILKKNGVLATSIPTSANFPMSRDVAPLTKVLYSSLKKAFKEVIIFPVDGVNYYVVSDGPLEHNVFKRLEQKGISTEFQYYDAPMLGLTDLGDFSTELDIANITGFPLNRIEEAKKAAEGGTTLNRDFRPLICYYTLKYWISQFGTPIKLFLIAGCIALLVYLVQLRAVPFAVFTTGFAAAGLEMVIIFGYQVLYGYVYHRVGVIVTMFMAGLAIGSFSMNRRLEKAALGTMVKVQFAVVLLSISAPLVLFGLSTLRHAALHFAGANLVIPLLTAATAFLVGFEFPLAAKLFHRDVPRTAGTLYCADLVGASVGAMAVSAALIPLTGFIYTCLLIGGINALSGAFLIIKRSRG